MSQPVRPAFAWVLLAVACGCSAPPPAAGADIDAQESVAAETSIESATDALSGAPCPWGPGECLWPANNDVQFGQLHVTDQYVTGGLATRTEVMVRFLLRGYGFPKSVTLQARLESGSAGALRVELQTALGAVVATGAVPHADLCTGTGLPGDGSCLAGRGSGQVTVPLNLVGVAHSFVVGDYYQLRVFAKALTGEKFFMELGKVDKGEVASTLGQGWTRVTTVQARRKAMTTFPPDDTLAFVFGVSPSRPASCTNGVRDGESSGRTETDIDCGGSCADSFGIMSRCKVGQRCGANKDCATDLVCRNAAGATCAAGELCSCGTKRKPGGPCSGDVDCQTGTCAAGLCRRARGWKCSASADCNPLESLACVKGVCEAGLEVDAVCAKSGECLSGLCSSSRPSVCLARNLAPQSPCTVKAQCESGICAAPVGTTAKVCVAPSTSDRLRNGTETDIDCGGASGIPCGIGKACTATGDCDAARQLSCDDRLCRAGEGAVVKSVAHCRHRAAARTGGGLFTCTRSPECSDGVLNGIETDIDRGGDCPRVGTAGKCKLDRDCESGRCGGRGQCLAPTCRDGVRNGGELAIDCGGRTCGVCPPGTRGVLPELATEGCSSKVVECAADTGCAGSTNPADYRCSVPRCDDAVVNGTESMESGTPEDPRQCGGSCGRCPATVAGGRPASCRTGADCASGVCKGGRPAGPPTGSCSPATSSDNVRNRDETGVDCDGSTSKADGTKKTCPLGQGCLTADDCVSGLVCLDSNGNDPRHPSFGGGRCSPDSCKNRLRNSRTESDVDCGKQCGTQCDPGKWSMCTCSTFDETGKKLGSGPCADVDCRNQTGERVSCGSSARVGNGETIRVTCACRTGADCLSGTCASSVCVEAGRNDGRRNGLETGIDCGCSSRNPSNLLVCSDESGRIARCALGSGCTVNDDCAYGICAAGVCTAGVCGNGTSRCGRLCLNRCGSAPVLAGSHGGAGGIRYGPTSANACTTPFDCGSNN